MPRRSRKNSKADGDGSYIDDDSSSSNSDVDDFFTLFVTRTPNELKSKMPIRYPNKFKKIMLTHAITYAYAAKSPPSLPVFLDLFLNKLGGRAVTNRGDKSIVKLCVKSVAGALTTLVCAGGTRDLVQEQKLDEDKYRVIVSRALIRVVKDDELEMSMFKNGVLKQLHAEDGHRFRAMHATDDPLPTSTTALVRIVVDHLIRTSQINLQPSGNHVAGQFQTGTPNFQAPIAARWGDTVTATEADARALEEKEKNRQAQKKAYSNFAKFIMKEAIAAKARGEPGCLSPYAKESWEWNGSTHKFDKKKDYVDWSERFLKAMIGPTLTSNDDEAESGSQETDEDAGSGGEESGDDNDSNAGESEGSN